MIIMVGRRSNWWWQIGQMQLLRRQIGHELNTTSKFDSKLLASALHNFNSALLTDIEAHYADPSKPYPKEDSPLMYELTTYLDWTGLSEPLAKIYTTPRPMTHLSLFLFLFGISQLTTKLTFVRSLGGALVAKRPADSIDGLPFVVGVLTLLSQYHQDHKSHFLAYLGQYVRSNLDSSLG
ncbi:KIAA0196 [Cordylochernes scorpioides]|uniref:KIAA0196 n=1 Tax=Cordylochernes scorpioides TaxID=51811 RepID=A0ABY6K8R2_9ARAC|nr:KIAA0196 [Cordylochernes scorpioides]